MWKLIFTVRGVAYKWTRIVPSRRAVCLPFPFFHLKSFSFFLPKKTWDTSRNSFFSFTNLRLSQEWLHRVNSARSVVGASLVAVVHVSSIQVLRVSEDQAGAQDLTLPKKELVFPKNL